MAASPVWKVYDAEGTYQAACKEPEAAACIVGNIYGEGATVRWNHTKIVFKQGHDSVDAGDSYDEAAALMLSRI